MTKPTSIRRPAFQHSARERIAHPARAGVRPLNVLACAALLMLSACGGSSNDPIAQTPSPGGGVTGGGTSGGGSGTDAPTLAILAGVAATGAPFAGADLTVVDQTGATVCAQSTLPNGSYSCPLPATTVAPLVIRAALAGTVLYSVATASTSGTANVTPLTTVVVSRLAPKGDPAQLAEAIRNAPASVTAATVKTQVDALVAALQPVLALLGETIDPLTGVFAADGTGQDKVLDALSITVNPDGTAANIEIAVKATPTAAQPDVPSLKFRSDVATIDPITLATGTTIPVLPKPDKLADFATRLTACFALPVSRRVTASSDSVNATGTASDVIAPACRTLFAGDDPSTYLNSGSAVGRDANNGGAFAGLFRPGATNLVWDRVTTEFVRENGDLVVSYRTTTAAKEIDTGTLVARAGSDGTVKLIGNQYVYAASVNPYSEDREFVNTPAFSYNTTGYTLNVTNRLDGNGNPVFSRVEVTTPISSQPVLTLLPSPGLSFMPIAINNAASGTDILRLAGSYQNSGTAGLPAQKELTLVFTPTPYTDTQIAALPNLSRWTYRFVHADGVTPDVIQSYHTIARAQTIAEIRQTPFVQFSAATKAEIVAETSANGYYIFNTAPNLVEPNIIDIRPNGGGDAWVVPAGAQAPTNISLNGRAPFGSTTAGQQGGRFNDGSGVSIYARSGIVYCSSVSVDDKHCDTSTNVRQYALGTTFNLIELSGRTARQVTISKKAALYKLVATP